MNAEHSLTAAALALIACKLQEQRSGLDALVGVKTLTLMVRCDRRSGQPRTVNVRAETETE